MKLDFGELIKYSLKYMFRRKQIFWFFIPFIVVSFILGIYRFFILSSLSLPPNYMIVSAIFSILSYIASIYAFVGVILAVNNDYNKRKWSVGNLSGEALRILPRFILYSIFLFVVLALPVIGLILLFIYLLDVLGLLLIIPLFIVLIYIYLRIYFGGVVLVVEDKGVIESIKRSISLTKDNALLIFGYLFGFMFIMFLIILIVMIVLGIIVFLIFFVSGLKSITLLFIDILNPILTSYYESVSIVFTYLIYRKLLEKKNINEKI